MKFSAFQISRIGGREINEDRMGYVSTSDSALFALADGMGGHPLGEVAAQIAVQTIMALFQKQAQPMIEDTAEFLRSALLAAHYQIMRHAQREKLHDTPRTTFVAAVVQERHAHWIHCGDSRLYHVRNGDVIARTRDHSYLELQRSAIISAQERVSRNSLFTCLGSPTIPIYDLSEPVLLEQGDRLLLCSDGLWGAIDDEVIARNLGRQEINNAVSDLVEDALDISGSHSDNVTAVAMEWEMSGEFESTSGSVGGPRSTHFPATVLVEAMDLFADSPDDLSDEIIERSIAEINEVIRRSAAAKKSS